jgi:hypothetical protein
MTPAHSAPTVVLGALVQIDGAWRQNPAQRAFAGDAYIYVRAGELPAIDDAVADPLCKVKLFHPFTRFTYYAYALTEYPGAGPVLTGLVTGLGEDEVGDTALRDIAELRVAHLPPERDLHWHPAPLSQVSATART